VRELATAIGVTLGAITQAERPRAKGMPYEKPIALKTRKNAAGELFKRRRNKSGKLSRERLEKAAVVLKVPAAWLLDGITLNRAGQLEIPPWIAPWVAE